MISLSYTRYTLLGLLLGSYLCRLTTFADERSIADKLETELDPRRPREFTVHEFLTVRVPGFREREFWKDGKGPYKQDIGNWEVWATKQYWYETRIPNASCPMVPEGIAATCDWALMVPCLFGDVTKPPRTIFVHNLMLSHFVESTFKFMNKSWSFVLVTGGTDQTIPANTGDVRYGRTGLRGFNDPNSGGAYFQQLVNSPQLIHWFAENRDISHEKMSSLPTGNSQTHPDDRSDYPYQVMPLEQRPLSIMNADRIRSGPQWNKRWQVHAWCTNNSLCLQPFEGKYDKSEGMTKRDFYDHMVSVPFIACVQGGGLDPSPKAWEALLLGTIPIIERNQIVDGYERLPVAIVDKWEDVFQNPDIENKMKNWIKELGPFYEEGSYLRLETLEVRLSVCIDEFLTTV